MAHVHAPAAPRVPQEALHGRRSLNRRRMIVALLINLALLGAEVVGGIITGSLALLADAGHLLSDVGSIGIGLVAGALAARPPGPRRTFGYQRTEVMAALINGVALVVVGVLILVAAASRFGDPPEVEGAGVLILGVVGLLGNAAATIALMGGDREDLNLEGVLRHSVADSLGSVGVIVAGVVILATGWSLIDPIVSIAIAALILFISWRLITAPLAILMEAAPEDVNVEELGNAMLGIEHVREVHELHVWTLTAGFEALAAHVVVDRGADRDLVRRRLEVLIAERAEIDHTTLQMEEEGGPELLAVED